LKPIIEVENLSKLYHLGTIGSTTLNDSVLKLFYKLRGKEEMARKIGEGHNTISPDDPQAGEEPNTFWALKDISFSIKKGEVIGLIGRNGAGKSTLLKILSRITEPTSGRAFLRGHASSLLEVGTGFHPDLTGKENIYLNGSIFGMRKREINKKFDAIVEFAELDKFVDTPVKRYSSGMYVRLAFSVAAHLDPEILLVDEVLAVGDVMFKKKCMGKIGDVAKEGRTIIFVSHDMSTIEGLCQSAILLDKGKLLMQGPTDTVVEKYLAINRESAKSQGAETIYEDDPDKDIIIRKITVFDSQGKPSAELDNRNPFITKIEFEVRDFKEGTFMMWMLRAPDYKVICTSCDDDLTGGKLAIQNKGQYLAKVTFPGNIINGGIYSIEFAIMDRMRTHCFDYKVINIYILNRQVFGLDRRKGTQRKGVLLMPINWEIIKS